jgi:purine-binding chemotaxis protein CheW
VSTISLPGQVKTDGEAAITDAARYLTFTLNGEAYALSIFNVTEILEYRQLTVVPLMPDFIRGVINLRGRAVPVVDLAIRFGRGTTAIGRRTSIIIVHINGPAAQAVAADLAGTAAAGTGRDGQDVGILVDAVNKVEAFGEDDIEPPPDFGAGIRADYISGMARRETDFIIVLDIDHVLSLGDVLALDVATGAASSEGGSAPSRHESPDGQSPTS